MECPACPAGPKDKLIQDLTEELKAAKTAPKPQPAPIAQPVKMVQDTEHSNKAKHDNVKATLCRPLCVLASKQRNLLLTGHYMCYCDGFGKCWILCVLSIVRSQGLLVCIL